MHTPESQVAAARPRWSRQLARGLLHGILEVAATVVAFTVLVITPGVLGWHMGGWMGVVIGAGAGALMLTALWVACLTAGAHQVLSAIARPPAGVREQALRRTDRQAT